MGTTRVGPRGTMATHPAAPNRTAVAERRGGTTSPDGVVHGILRGDRATAALGVGRMRRGRVLGLLALASGVVSVTLAVAVNVATGGVLPPGLRPLAAWAWPAVGVGAAAATGLALWQQRLQLPEPPRPDAASRPTPAQLPPMVADFTGREADEAALRASIAGGARVVAIAGPPGVGKSTLANRLAHLLREEHPDGQLYVNLGAGRGDPLPPDEALARFLAALGDADPAPYGDVEALAARYRSLVAGRRLLVVLDDAHDAGQVRPLLPAGPHCLTVVTSRPLPADLPEAASYELAPLGTADAMTLLARVSGSAGAAADPEAAAAVVRACGGLPLAIRVAGARAARSRLAVAELARRLEDERSRLDELHFRAWAVRATLATAYEDLAPRDRRLLRRLGAFPGGEFPVGAAAALAGFGSTDGTDAAEARDGLDRLMDAQLVESAGGERHRLHDLIRLFARERLAEEEPPTAADRVTECLLDWYAAAARDNAPRWIAHEAANLAAVARQGAAAGARDRVFALAEAAEHGWHLQHYHVQRLRVWQAVEEAGRAVGDARMTARSALVIGSIHGADGNMEQAAPLLREAAQLAERTGDTKWQADAHRHLGDVLRQTGGHSGALDHLRRARELYHALGLTPDEADTLGKLATVHLVRWEFEQAARESERALALLADDARSSPAYAQLRGLAAAAYIRLGRIADGRSAAEEAVAVHRRAGNRLGEAYGLGGLGHVACEEGDTATALDCHRTALRLFEELGNAPGTADAHADIGGLLALRGDHAGAIGEFEAAITVLSGLGHPVAEALCRLRLAEALALAGDPEGAAGQQRSGEALLAGAGGWPQLDAVRARLAALGLPAATG
jgi:tetratricopeptide (TPR) repeat protein